MTLLKSGGKSVIDENGGGGDEDLVDLTDPNENHEDRVGLIKRDSEKVASLEGKIFFHMFLLPILLPLMGINAGCVNINSFFS